MFGIKGVGGEGRPLVGRPSKNNIGKVRLYPLGADTAKELVHGRLRIADPGPGYCHFPNNRDSEYFLQLTAEQLVTRYVRGHAKRQWVKKRRRNEALDVRCYAMAALYISGININILADKIAEQRPQGDGQKAEPRKRQANRKSGGFVNNWR